MKKAEVASNGSSKAKVIEKEVNAVAVQGSKEAIILPVGMSKMTAAEMLFKMAKEEEKVISLSHSFNKWYYMDVLVAIKKVTVDTFGWMNAKDTRSMWGSNPPKEIQVPTGFDLKGKETFEDCFYGNFEVIQWDNAKGNTNIQGDKISLAFEIKRKFAERAKKFFTLCEEYLEQYSIYRGKCLAFKNDGLVFIKNIVSPHIFLNEAEEKVVQIFILNALQKKGKRTMLFTGDFGVGKTETAMRIGKAASNKGITFIYCKEASKFTELLALAQNYAPAMVFLEDVDEIGGGDRGERLNELLNTLDGIESKGKSLQVIFTTNNEDKINKALRRPGRLDLILKFRHSELKAIEKIYESKFAMLNNQEFLNYPKLAEITGVTQGAIVAQIAERAIALAEDNENYITQDIAEAAIESMAAHREYLERDDVRLPKEQEVMRGLLNLISDKIEPLVNQ